MRPTSGKGSSSWPTPTASDAGYFPDILASQGEISLTAPFDIVPESGGQYALNNAARVWTVLWLTLKALGARPGTMAGATFSPPVRLSFKNGKGSFAASLVSNPAFYEWMMGWPIGWTAPGARVTAYAAWLRHSRGAFSRLITSFEWPVEQVSKGV